MPQTVQINRKALGEARIVDAPAGALADGAVRLRIESFSVTANNVTYAVAAIKELGPKAFGEAVAESWLRFIAEAGGALTIDTRAGLEAARNAFAATLAGKADPAVGIVIRP